MSIMPQLLMSLLLLTLIGCSIQPDPVRLAPQQSGGWRKDNILVLYQKTYPATQMTSILISNGINGWEKIDFKHNNNQIFELLSQSQMLTQNKNSEIRKIKSYLSLQLNSDNSVKSVAYWHDEHPSTWPMEKLASYQKLFSASQQQAIQLKQNEQRLWLGEVDLINKNFTPCGAKQSFDLELSEELLARLIKNWQSMAKHNKVWLAVIGSDGSNGEISVSEQLLVQPPRPSNCLILRPIGKA